jgi:hypothetical protein
MVQNCRKAIFTGRYQLLFIFIVLLQNRVFADDSITASGNYVLGRLTRNTDMITLRLSYALTPEFTIQYYGSPYISIGKYAAFKTLENPDTEDPDKVFHTFTENEIRYNEDTRNVFLIKFSYWFSR